VANFNRPPGMPIGTGAAGGEPLAGEPELPPDSPSNESAQSTGSTELSIPKFAAAPTTPPPAIPCSGCMELNVDVNDINQRDEFVFAVDGSRVTRVVWSIRVNFNSDQLAVQPLIDSERGKYTNLHVNTFPLGEPVEVEQIFKGRPRIIGLVVGSSGAWTGNQTMSVFVDSVRVEGPRGFEKTFDFGPEGLAPRTQNHNPKAVFHPRDGGTPELGPGATEAARTVPP
jgi:hypothetical protein